MMQFELDEDLEYMFWFNFLKFEDFKKISNILDKFFFKNTPFGSMLDEGRTKILKKIYLTLKDKNKVNIQCLTLDEVLSYLVDFNFLQIEDYVKIKDLLEILFSKSTPDGIITDKFKTRLFKNIYLKLKNKEVQNGTGNS